MASCTIGHCSRTAPDGHHACPLHANELRGWLAELPRQAVLLEAFVTPAGRPRAGRLGGTGLAHAPAPVDLRVLNLLVGPGHYDPRPGTDDDGEPPITATLGAWAGHIAYHHPAVGYDPHGTARTQPCEQAWPSHGETIAGWCTWHLAYLPFTLTLPLLDEYHRQLGGLIRRIRDLTHTTPRKHPQGAPCPQCGIFALVRTDGQWDISCTSCGHQMEPEAYDEHAAQFLETASDPQPAS